jgi:DNA polymerase III gamma/tau subunit
MLSQTLRPKTLDEVAGQKEAKEIIKAILKSPEKSPKCLIFSGGWGQGKTTLSRIVARELNHIKDENYNILESPFYYELDSTVVGNIEEIRKLRDVFAVSYGDSWRVVTLDECVHYETNIRVMDAQGKEFCCRIGKLVSKKPVGWKALSVNKEGVFSYKPILNFFNNGKKDFYKVDIEVSRKTYNRNCRSYYNKSVVCTNNHRFFDENFKEVKLKDLKVGDVISTYEDYSNNKAIRRSIYHASREFVFSEDIISFFRGSVLGDAGVDAFSSGSFRYRFTQSVKHYEYFKLIKRILGDLFSCETHFKSGYGGKDVLSVTSKVCENFKDVFGSLYCHGKKIITREYLDLLSPLSIAVWYMDDGALTHNKGKEANVILSTHAYSKEENLIIIDYFKEVYDIQFKLGHDHRCDKFFIYACKKSERDKFFALVSKYIIDLFQYKLGKGFTCGNKFCNTESIYYKFYEGNFKFLGKGIIKSIKPYVDTHVSAYDIEVADNHNYVTAGGIVLHNCHAVSSVAQTALLKMLEETQGNTLYILATTDPQKLLPTIRSRALEVHFSPVPVNEIVDNLTHVAEKYNIEISQKVKQIIADRSGGHVRNAHMLLDKYLLLGEEEFIKSVHSALSLYVDYLEAVYNDNKDDILKSLNLLTDIPKDILKEDWNTLVVESMKVSCGFECIHEDIKRLLSVYGKDFGILSQCYMSNWVRDAFIDMPYFQVVFLNLYKVIRGQMQKVSININRVGNKEENKFGKPVR